MPQTLPNGLQVPINSDAYNLAADLATMGNSANVVFPVANQTVRDALTPFNGMVVFRLDTGAVEVYFSSSWKPVTQATGASPYRAHCGTTTFTLGAGVAGGTQAVTFPAAFNVAPIVVTSIATTVGSGASNLISHHTSVTTTGFSCQVQTSDNSAVGASYTIPVTWMAMQMTPTVAAG
jgi:hypothetical protein